MINKLELLTNATVVDDVFRFSSSHMEKHGYYLLLTERQRKNMMGFWIIILLSYVLLVGEILFFLDGKG